MNQNPIFRVRLHDLYNGPCGQHDPKSLLNLLGDIFEENTVGELISDIFVSGLHSKLTTLKELISSSMIHEDGLLKNIRQIFADFNSTQQGQDNLLTVYKILHLLNKPCSELSDAQNEQLEELKTLIRFSLNDEIIAQMMHLREVAQSRRVVPCNCQNCKEIQDNRTFGWYFLAQAAYIQGMFWRCEG